MRGLLVAVIASFIVAGCALGRLVETNEGRKALLASPEIREIIAEPDIVKSTKKWCALSPLIRLSVRLEAADAGQFIPIISDPKVCEVQR